MNGEPKEYLDYCVDKYFHQLLEKYEFKLTDQKMSAMAVSKTFSNDRLILTIVNDRGIIETRIASIYSSNNWWDFDLLNALLNRNDAEKSFGRTNSVKSLALSEVSELLDSKMEVIRELFDKENYQKTGNALSEIGEKRVESIFGIKLK